MPGRGQHLSPAERVAHIKMREQLWNAINAKKAVTEDSLGGQSLATQKASDRKDRPQNQKQFAASTAAVAKMSKSAVNQELLVARLATSTPHGLYSRQDGLVACQVGAALQCEAKGGIPVRSYDFPSFTKCVD